MCLVELAHEMSALRAVGEGGDGAGDGQEGKVQESNWQSGVLVKHGAGIGAENSTGSHRDHYARHRWRRPDDPFRGTLKVVHSENLDTKNSRRLLLSHLRSAVSHLHTRQELRWFSHFRPLLEGVGELEQSWFTPGAAKK